MKQTKNELRYIPAPLQELLHECDYPRKDDLYCIIDQIYRRQIHFKNELQKKYGFIEIARAVFLKLIPKPLNVKNGLDFLVEQGFIIRNDYYTYGIQAKGYKIKNEFLGTKVAVEITDKKINARIKEEKMKMRNNRAKNLDFAKSKYYKTFKIDVQGALAAANDKAMNDLRDLVRRLNYQMNTTELQQIIDCSGEYINNRMKIVVREEGRELHNILHRLMIHQQQIHCIADGFLYFKRNKTNGRLDTNLTSLPSYLRKFLISDEKLFNLDLKNSQPFFLFTRLKSSHIIDQDELMFYGKLVVDGKLYEHLAEQFEVITGKQRTREEMKKILFKIFYSKVTSYESYKETFRAVFPSIMEHIDLCNFEKHNTLAIELQTLESFTILDIVMPELKTLGIAPFTIHDSFIVTEEEMPIVIDVITRKFNELHGLVPALHQEELFNLEVDDCEDEMFEDDNEYFPESFFAA